MKAITIRADSPTLIITRKWFFFKSYQLYMPLDGLYDVQHFTVEQQIAAARATANAAGTK